MYKIISGIIAALLFSYAVKAQCTNPPRVSTVNVAAASIYTNNTAAGFAATSIFDDNDNTVWQSAENPSYLEVSVTLPVAIKLCKLSILFDGNSYATNYQVSGTKDWAYWPAAASGSNNGSSLDISVATTADAYGKDLQVVKILLSGLPGGATHYRIKSINIYQQGEGPVVPPVTSTGGWSFGGNTVTAVKTIGTIDNYDLPFITNNTERMRIETSGRVRIGALTHDDAKLSVDGNIYARKLTVTQNSWADYVFTKNYFLLTLPKVEAYIKTFGHLPGVPSEAAVLKDGISVGDNQAILLQKIEELTLYLIDQNKKINQLQLQVKKQDKKIQRLSGK